MNTKTFLLLFLGMAGVLAVFLYGTLKPESERGLIRVGIPSVPRHEPANVAREHALWRLSEIELVDFASAAEMSLAFRNDSIDAMITTLGDALLSRTGDNDLRIVMLAGETREGYGIVAHSGFASIRDLRGKRVAVEASAAGMILLHRALASSKMKSEDFEIVSVDLPDHGEAFNAGTVDAVVTNDPGLLSREDQQAHRVYDLSSAGEIFVEVLAVRSGLIDSRPDDVAVLATGLLKAAEQLRGLSPSPASSPSSLPYEPIRYADTELNRAYFSGSEPKIDRLVVSRQTDLAEAGWLRHFIPPNEIVDRRMFVNIPSAAAP